MGIKIKTSVLVVWSDEHPELMAQFTDDVLNALAKNYGDTISDVNMLLRESGRYSVTNNADMETLYREAGFTVVRDGSTTRITL